MQTSGVNVGNADVFFWNNQRKFIAPTVAAFAQGVEMATEVQLTGHDVSYNPNVSFSSPVCFHLIYNGEYKGSCAANSGISETAVCPDGYQYAERFTGGYCQLVDQNLNACPVDQDLPEQKNLGCDAENDDTYVGNPCSPATGNKYQMETDIFDSALPFARHYNSLFKQDVGMGFGWTSPYHKRREITAQTSVMRRANGRGESFTLNGSTWFGDADSKLRLSQDATGYTVSLRDGSTERYDLLTGRLILETSRAGNVTTYNYDAAGRLTSVVGPFGHAVTFGYDGSGHVSSITDAAGRVISYTYDANSNLTRVSYPDGTARVYQYENSAFPHHLTGISVDNGAGVITRLATYGYDANGRAILTEHAVTTNGVGQERYTLTYDSTTQTTVTDGLGNRQVMVFQELYGTKKLVSKTNQADGKAAMLSFDSYNNLISRTDEEGRRTSHTYNGSNQLVSRTEATGSSSERTSTHAYLSTTLDLPTLIESPSVYSAGKKLVEIVYDTARNPVSVTQRGHTGAGAPISRSVGFTYNTAGQVIRIDGPRVDVPDITVFDYYACTAGGGCGQLKSVTNALGQTTTYDSYDAYGRLTQTTDPNGVKMTYAYDLRGRLISVTQVPPAGAGSLLQTQYNYDAAGNLTQVTAPDGRALSYHYDAAQDLRSITDNLGNKIEYVYDIKGNRIAEKTYDPDGSLVRSIEMSYDVRNRVSSINTGGSITQTVYDAIGNLVKEIDPNNQGKAVPANTSHGYDALNRLIQTVDRLSGLSTMSYDVNNRLKTVAAANNTTTQYESDDLGNLLKEISPDRGTLTYTYDEAGNVKTLTDARGVTVLYTYDALNRVTLADYPGTDEDITYVYDAGPNCGFGAGRLCQITDGSGVTEYRYDVFENIVEVRKTDLGVMYLTRYEYDAGNRLVALTYPDSRRVSYVRDAVGRVTAVTTTLGGGVTTLASNVSYRADGLLTGMILGNGIIETRVYDLQGRLTQQTRGAEVVTYTYDLNGNVVATTKVMGNGNYVYDVLDRVTSESLPLFAQTFTYDANSNRLNDGRGTYTYLAASNRLNSAPDGSLTLDAAGNVLADGSGRTFSYNARGQLTSVSANALELGRYVYNAQSLRTRKLSGTTTVYHYDLHGRLMQETDAAGAAVRTYVWLNDLPLAQIRGTTAFLHTDHLSTPRSATDSTGSVIWRWEGHAFGDSAPAEDPDGDGTVTTINLRFPGQYYDAETGLFYNHHRYYSSEWGRYISSDPIGLKGGLNSYAYTLNNPLRWIDPTGQISTDCIKAFPKCERCMQEAEKCRDDHSDPVQCLERGETTGISPGAHVLKTCVFTNSNCNGCFEAIIKCGFSAYPKPPKPKPGASEPQKQ